MNFLRLLVLSYLIYQLLKIINSFLRIRNKKKTVVHGDTVEAEYRVLKEE